MATALRAHQFPVLPAPASWYPGHMTQFARLLPTLLTRTDVVLELRDARLPLTSINRNFEAALQKWQRERARPGSSGADLKWKTYGAGPAATAAADPPCERIVVFNKRDLVPEWGIEPFQRAMAAKYPAQTVLFASWTRQRDIRRLHDVLVDVARRNPHAAELNVLVVGMPNVGKSTLLNALRSSGIPGPTAKALRTSANPGLTRALSTRLKLSLDPPVYAFDTPGVMLPFLGKGDRGAERAVKLALIAGIKEGLYDVESLAAYLLYRLNILDPVAPAYLPLLPEGTPPVVEVEPFLEHLARRLGMLRKGGIPDAMRAAVWFIKWWREEGGLAAAASSPALAKSRLASLSPSLSSSLPAPAPQRRGWGFDFEWTVGAEVRDPHDPEFVQRKMEECVDRFERDAAREAKEGGGMSATQEKKIFRDELLAKRAARTKARLGSRRGAW